MTAAHDDLSTTAQKLLAVLTEYADEGVVDLQGAAGAAIREATGDKDSYKAAVGELVKAGRVRVGKDTLTVLAGKPVLRAVPDPPAEGAPAKRGPGRPKASEVPRPRVHYRQPDGQNQHMFKIINHRGLTDTEQHVGMMANFLIGHVLAERGKHRGVKITFGDPTEAVELANAKLASDVNRPSSASKVGQAMTKMVELGLFRRLDNGQGNSRKRSNNAAYVPIVPV